MDFNSISKSLQDAIVNVTKEQHSLEENDIVGVIDGVRSDRKYNDEFHAHNSLGKLVAYQKAKKAELYVNGEKTKHYELNKRYDDFEPKKLSEQSIEQIDEVHQDDDSIKKAVSDFMAKGGKVKQVKPKKEPKAKFYSSRLSVS